MYACDIVVTRTSSINYYGTKLLTENVLNNEMINKETGRIIFVSSTSGVGAFNRSNAQLKSRIVDIVDNGTKQDFDQLMDTFAQAVKRNKNNVFDGNMVFPKSAYGMSKVCKFCVL